MRTFPNRDVGHNPLYQSPPPPSPSPAHAPLPPINDGWWGGGGGGNAPPRQQDNPHHQYQRSDFGESNEEHNPRGFRPSQQQLTLPAPGPTFADAGLQSIEQRLADNERTQRELAQETSRLQAAVADAFRFHEDVLRDEAQLRRIFQDHSRFFETVVQHMQAQLSAMSQQLALEREAAYRSIETARQAAAEHSAAQTESLRTELRAAITDTTTAIRSALDAQHATASATADACMQRCSEIERAASAARNETAEVGARLAQVASGFAQSLDGTDQALGRSLAKVDERFVSVADAETRAVQVVRDDLAAQAAGTDRALRERDERITAVLDGQHESLAVLGRRMDEMGNALHTTLVRQASARETELIETLKVIKAAHAVIKGTREEERANREALKRELREEMRRETAALKQDLEGQIQQMIKPFVII
ncbi:hypothetical protein HDU87_001824 [Geranomyces variabilis]|uniref:Uncharacterized protein n=1 Tax=Geranomyces variabilis TaxID=109894 RepID=A0AAD5TM54_9FUNG|nr:hypothetical protein HDU87_001824 [Geranomyces variabilis]